MFKVLVASSFMMFSVKALACPNVAGLYSCQLPSQVVELEVKQNANTFSIRLGAETRGYVADNIPKTEKINQYGIETTQTQTGSCTANSLNANVVITQQNLNLKLTSIVDLTISKAAVNTVDLRLKMSTLSNDVLDEDSVDATIVCTKK